MSLPLLCLGCHAGPLVILPPLPCHLHPAPRKPAFPVCISWALAAIWQLHLHTGGRVTWPPGACIFHSEGMQTTVSCSPHLHDKEVDLMASESLPFEACYGAVTPGCRHEACATFIWIGCILTWYKFRWYNREFSSHPVVLSRRAGHRGDHPASSSRVFKDIPAYINLGMRPEDVGWVGLAFICF